MNDHPRGSAPEPVSRPLRNVADLARSAAARFGDRPALLSSGPARSWAELDSAVDAGVADLRPFGLGVGDRVVVALPSGPDLAVALLATARAGLVAVPIGPDRLDVGAVADLVGAAAAIATDRRHGLPIALDAERVRSWWDRAPQPAAPAVAGGEDLAWLARAGRGSRPVMISHRAILAGSGAVPQLPSLELSPDDRVLQLLPLYHLAGWVTSFLPLALLGGAAVHPDPATAPADPDGAPVDPVDSARSTARAALAAITRHRATVLPTTPGLCHALLVAPGAAAALASVRLITSATAPLAPADVALAQQLTSRPVWEGYGITESCGVVTSTLTGPEPRLGSVGRPLPGVQIRVVGPDGREVDVVPGPHPAARDRRGHPDADPTADLALEGEVGRIVVRSPSLFSGYWPDGGAGPAADGWFVTGDLGYLDETGELHLVDRFAETINVSGFTVYPREVETVLLAHPWVAQAAVVGVAGPAGPQVVAVYTLRPPDRTTGDVPAAGPPAEVTVDGTAGSADGTAGARADGTPDIPARSAADAPADGSALAGSSEGGTAGVPADGSNDDTVGVPADDDRPAGDRPAADPPADGTPAPQAGSVGPTVTDLRAHVEARLAPFKRPSAYQQVPTLPRTEVGRIDRSEVARDYVRTWGRNRPPLLTAVPPAPPAGPNGVPALPGQGDQPPVDTTPEQVGDLTQLGTRLPAGGDRRHRGRRDTDDDLF